MKLAKLFQRNINTIFEVERTNKELEEILARFKALLNILDSVSISIKFGKKAKRTLGSVRLKGESSIIYITKYMVDYSVPDYVIEEVILHELIHIKTGYGSIMQKTSRHAHRGGVIKKEMLEIGKSNIYELSQIWIKKNWYSHIKNFNKKEKQLLKKII